MGWFSSKPRQLSLSEEVRDALFAALHKQASPTGDDSAIIAIAIEYHLPQGMDLVMAFAGEDGARYYNHSGRAVLWSLRGDVGPFIDKSLAAGKGLLRLAGLHDGSKMPEPTLGEMRLSVFTKRGWHYGQGPVADLSEAPEARAFIAAGSSLMQKLMTKSPPKP